MLGWSIAGPAQTSLEQTFNVNHAHVTDTVLYQSEQRLRQ